MGSQHDLRDFGAHFVPGQIRSFITHLTHSVSDEYKIWFIVSYGATVALAAPHRV